MSELRECPLAACNGPAEYVYEPGRDFYPGDWHVRCTKCGLRTHTESGSRWSREEGTVPLPDEAKAALAAHWNTRPVDAVREAAVKVSYSYVRIDTEAGPAWATPDAEAHWALVKKGGHLDSLRAALAQDGRG